jgi:hypothetical protein
MATQEKTSSRQVNALIKSVRTYGDKYNNVVQSAIVAIITHADAYGDCTGAGRLVDAMPNSNRRTLVINHFTDYSPIQVSKSPKTGLFMAKNREPEAKNYNKFDVEGAKANNWFEREEAAKLPDVITFDSSRESLNKFLEAQIKKADKSDDKDAITAFYQAVRSAASGIAVKSINKYDDIDLDIPQLNEVKAA